LADEEKRKLAVPVSKTIKELMSDKAKAWVRVGTGSVLSNILSSKRGN